MDSLFYPACPARTILMLVERRPMLGRFAFLAVATATLINASAQMTGRTSFPSALYTGRTNEVFQRVAV